MTQTAQTAPSEIRILDEVFGGSGKTNISNYMQYTEDLFDALVLVLTQEESVAHSLSLLIGTRLQVIKQAIEAA